MKQFPPPVFEDLFSAAIEHVRPFVDPALPVTERLQNLWGALVWQLKKPGAGEVI